MWKWLTESVVLQRATLYIPWVSSLQWKAKLMQVLLWIKHTNKAPLHRSRIVCKWFEEHDRHCRHLWWPPQPLDLNPIEHIWNGFKTTYSSLVSSAAPSAPHQRNETFMTEWIDIPSRHLSESPCHVMWKLQSSQAVTPHDI